MQSMICSQQQLVIFACNVSLITQFEVLSRTLQKDPYQGLLENPQRTSAYIIIRAVVMHEPRVTWRNLLGGPQFHSLTGTGLLTCLLCRSSSTYLSLVISDYRNLSSARHLEKGTKKKLNKYIFCYCTLICQLWWKGRLSFGKFPNNL